MNTEDERDHAEEAANEEAVRAEQSMPNPETPTAVPAVDVRAELARVVEVATQALRSLDDENEGDFRRDILELHTRAATLLHVVATW